MVDNNQNINSLNIFTLIKEIYQSIKSFHKKVDLINDEQKRINQTLTKLNSDFNLKYQQHNDILNLILQKVESNEEIDLKLRQNLESKLTNLMTTHSLSNPAN